MDLVHQLFQLNHLYRSTNALYGRYVARTGISPTVPWIMYALHPINGNCTQSEFCSQWGISAQTANSAIKKMEREGLIELCSVEGNRKSKLLRLTRRGELLSREIVSPLIDAELQALKAMTDEERAEMLRLEQRHYEEMLKFISAPIEPPEV